MPELTIPTETLLDALTKDELVAAVEQLELEVAERRAKAPLVRAVADLSQDDLATVLDALGRERLKEVCRKFKQQDLREVPA